MLTKKKQCEGCEENQENSQGLREKIWLTQLENKREIYLNSDVNDSVIELVVIQIQNINDYDAEMEKGVVGYEREPIKLFINSVGGSVYEALSVCSAIEASETPVHTIAMGKALSAGFLILICGHLRYAQKYATIMHHTGSSGIMGVFTDIIEEAESLEKLNNKIHKLILDHTNISEDQLDEVFFRKNNWYLDAEEALEAGVVDGIWGFPLPDIDDYSSLSRVTPFSGRPEDEAEPCNDCEHYDPENPCPTCYIMEEEPDVCSGSCGSCNCK